MLTSPVRHGSIAQLAASLADEELRATIKAYGANTELFVNEEHWRGAWRIDEPSTRPSGLTIFSYVRYAVDFMNRFGTRIFLAVGPEDSTRLSFVRDRLIEQGLLG